MAVRGVALAAAIVLPTVAAQGQWGGVAALLGFGSAQAAPAPMPFELPGQNFPGSAFYYVEDDARLTYDLDALRRAGSEDDAGGGEAVQFSASHDPGAAAQAFRSGGSGIDKARALQCLSMAVYYEAASESHAGQQAVAQVVLNRVAHPAYPASVCGVVFQGSERSTGCQFTFTCDGSLARRPSRGGWARAQSVALAALAGSVYAPVGLATHYHTNYVNPYWAASLDFIRTIGAHRFYRWKGHAGRAGAFDMAYRGNEPLAAPAPREQSGRALLSASAAPPPNAALGEGAIVPVGGAVPEAAATPAPAPTPTDSLPSGGRVRPEYERSGRWIRQPG